MRCARDPLCRQAEQSFEKLFHPATWWLIPAVTWQLYTYMIATLSFTWCTSYPSNQEFDPNSMFTLSLSPSLSLRIHPSRCSNIPQPRASFTAILYSPRSIGDGIYSSPLDQGLFGRLSSNCGRINPLNSLNTYRDLYRAFLHSHFTCSFSPFQRGQKAILAARQPGGPADWDQLCFVRWSDILGHRPICTPDLPAHPGR